MQAGEAGSVAAPVVTAPGLAGAVSGRIFGQEGRPVVEAEVALMGGPPPGQRLVLSRRDGFFRLPDVPASTYELRVTAPGAIAVRIPAVVIDPAVPLEVQVRLVDYPVELASRETVILPQERPLPPQDRRALPE